MRIISSVALGLLILCSVNSRGQNSPEAVNTADSLSFMLGTWEGEGWIKMGREKKTFLQTEILTSKVDGKVISLEGLGTSTDSLSKEVTKVHDAFGMIYYDTEQNGFRMIAFSTAAPMNNVEFKAVGKRKMRWQFVSEQGGTVRFTEDFSNPGKWLETGEYSMDGQKWFPFFESHLSLKP